VSNNIVDFKKEKFISDCKMYLKTGNISENLLTSVSAMSPGMLDYIKKGLDAELKKIIDVCIKNITDEMQHQVIDKRRNLNLICNLTLDNLETRNIKFIIPEVISRYRDNINPVKALFFDIQEIIFLYDEKPKNNHHMFLIEKFSEKESWDEIINAIKTDLKNINECRTKIENVTRSLKYSVSSNHTKKIINLYTEMNQWITLFALFPEWVRDNKNDGYKSETKFNSILTRYFGDIDKEK
jgi:hypothetical protein